MKEQIKAKIERIFDNPEAWHVVKNTYGDVTINEPILKVEWVADQILALFPQGDKIDGNALPSAAYDEYFTPPQGEGGHWIFKTDKLTPLQVKATVCQQCPFPGALETKCDWCDNPKMMEFLRLAISAIDDFYNQSKQAALKAQMERVIRVIDRRIAEQERVFDLAVRTKTNAKLQVLKAIKAELEGEGLVLELGCHYLNSEFECEKGLLINSKCPSECVYYDDGSR